MINSSFWSGKRVFLTGHTGFKGTWLSLWLQHIQAELTGYSLAPEGENSFFDASGAASGMHSVIGDIRDSGSLLKAVEDARPDVVIHMAAQALVRRSYADPVETYSTNVMGLVNLLEAVRGCGSVRAIVNVTSDKCYENREWVWGYREDEPMGGHDPYSSSKACAEIITSAYRRSFFGSEQQDSKHVAIATARAGNVIGGGDWSNDRLVPDVFRAIHAGAPVVLRSPNAVRPWQHVLEALSGYLLLAERLFEDGVMYEGGWNFGPAESDARSVRWIVGQLIDFWGEGAISQLDQAPNVHEANSLKLDCSKARTLLGWNTVWALDKTLGKIVEWHKVAKSRHDCRDVTLAQLQEFCADMSAAGS